MIYACVCQEGGMIPLKQTKKNLWTNDLIQRHLRWKYKSSSSVCKILKFFNEQSTVNLLEKHYFAIIYA